MLPNQPEALFLYSEDGRKEIAVSRFYPTFHIIHNHYYVK